MIYDIKFIGHFYLVSVNINSNRSNETRTKINAFTKAFIYEIITLRIIGNFKRNTLRIPSEF